MANKNVTNMPGFGWAGAGVFQKGKGKTLAVPMEVHASSCAKLCGILRDRGITSGVVLLQGGDDQCQYDSDTELVFRQDSWFQYLFGVKEPGVFGMCCVLYAMCVTCGACYEPCTHPITPPRISIFRRPQHRHRKVLRFHPETGGRVRDLVRRAPLPRKLSHVLRRRRSQVHGGHCRLD